MCKCPVCEGKTGWQEDFGEGTIVFEGCSYCNETGHISLFARIEHWLWQFEFVETLYLWLESGLTKRAADVEYCACNNNPPVHSGVCIACGLPRIPRG